MELLGDLWIAAAATVLVVGVVVTVREMLERRRPLDLDPLPWWYCCYCGSVFNHSSTDRALCETALLLQRMASTRDSARSLSPVTGNPNE